MIGGLEGGRHYKEGVTPFRFGAPTCRPAKPLINGVRRLRFLRPSFFEGRSYNLIMFDCQKPIF